MNPRLQNLSAQRYAEQVLPLTQPIWGHGRPLDEYQKQTAELALSAYGRKSYRTLALADGERVLSTYKRYERDARVGNERLTAIGIGAVFTPEEFRGRGFASAMLGMALDDARAAGVDFAFLFSDIHPQFYKELGFAELPSRLMSFRADSLEAGRIDAQAIGQRDWSGVRACFDAMEKRAEFGLVRSPAVWNWIRVYLAQASQRAQTQPVNVAVRRGRSVAAYLIGRRRPLDDTYVVDEVGFGGAESAVLVPALLRFAAGDLRRIAGWLPRAPARAVLPRGAVRKRTEAVWMIAPLSAGGSRFLERALRSGPADGVWSLDHI